MSIKIILGTAQFGLYYGVNNISGKPSEDKVFRILEYANLNGIKILDTADAYGNASELIGEFNKSHPEIFQINTKFKASEEPVAKQLNKCLEKLHINTVNIYFFHAFEDLTNYPNLIAEVASLKDKGLIKKIGVSVYSNDEFEVAINTPEVDVIQFPFNLLDNRSQRGELMMLAKKKGKKLQIRSVFLQGLFFMSLANIPSTLNSLKPYLEKIIKLANQNNLSIESLALIYALSQPEIDHVIIGVDSIEQLKGNLNAMRKTVYEGIIEEINQITVVEKELLYPKTGINENISYNTSKSGFHTFTRKNSKNHQR